MPEADPGYGPPPGKPSGPARGGGALMAREAREYASGLVAPNDDPAFAAPVDATDARATAKLIYRDLPLVTIQNTWTIDEARGAIYAHLVGQFYTSGMLCDSIMGDDRVTATLNSRASALFGREPRFKAANDSAAAKECLDAWVKWWPRLCGDAAIRETHDYAIMMGFGHDQIVWAVEGDLAYAPTLRPWHPVFTWYDWDRRVFQAIGQDGMHAIVPGLAGGAKWLEHAPYGSYRGWIRGALRPVVEPWMLRHFGFRDMARFGEVHGNPTRVGDVPIVGDPIERENFENAIAGLGADAALIVPGGVDPKDGNGYNYRLVEATSKAWEVHPAQIDRCDMAIVLAILMVNLTTEVNGGSYAAAKVASDKEHGGTAFDNQGWKKTYYRDLARPFAFLNFGDASLAPWTDYDVVPHDQRLEAAELFAKVTAGVEVLRRGGVQFVDADELREWLVTFFGLTKLPRLKMVEPVKQTPEKAGEGGTTPPKPGGAPPGGT